MTILIIDNGTSFLNKLVKLFNGNDVTVTPFNKISFSEAKKFDLIILSGGHKYSVQNHHKNYRNELDIIKRVNKPIIGICLGFELIASDFGCQLKRLRKKEQGVISISLKSNRITKGMDSINVYESHRWVITKVNNNLTSLGTSTDGIEIIKHKTKPIYGFQFHPEIIKNGAKGKQLFTNLLAAVKG